MSRLALTLSLWWCVLLLLWVAMGFSWWHYLEAVRG